jgi:hypothetical protein
VPNDTDTGFETPGADAPQRAYPFKFLDPYGPEDAVLFFGRGFEIAELYARLYSSPLTVVYGESGTGKTSLIQCGLRNRVPPEDILFVSVRIALDPETTLRQELAKAVASAPDRSEDLDALVRRVIRRSYKTLVLVFDQFEEFFLFQPESVRQSFARRLSGWLDEGLNLRLVIAIHEEFPARLGAASAVGSWRWGGAGRTGAPPAIGLSRAAPAPPTAAPGGYRSRDRPKWSCHCPNPAAARPAGTTPSMRSPA